MLRRRFVGAASLARALHTPPERRKVVVHDIQAADEAAYPTVYHGLSYTTDIFGLQWTNASQRKALDDVWNRDCFLPTTPAAPLDGTPFAILSDIAQQQAVELKDGSAGHIAKNQLRNEVKSRIVDQETHNQLFQQFMKHLEGFQEHPTRDGAQLISNVAFWTQWLIRGILFEGKQHDQKYTDAVIPAPLSKIAFAANAAVGRHQVEFVYDDYTLKAANFPKHRTFEDVNYDDAQDILKFIAEIDTPVGFCDMAGGKPEHNFRHNHSVMEQQMRRAFKGWEKMSNPSAGGRDIVEGWSDIATAAERAHKVFNTMMTNTPADTYPKIRLPIKGVRGACGNVYPPDGVFYEDCGTDQFRKNADVSTIVADPRPGAYVDREFGQTGANSSMYKWFDIFVGVTQQRHAYSLAPEQRGKMLRVLRGEEDAGEMGDNPIDSMQRAFDLLTRPPVHLDNLVQVANAVDNGPYLNHAEDPRLKDCWELAAFERFKTAFYVASHRNVHGKYVLKMIYQTKPVGGQSRAEGTGGSTPPFLKTFFDQTFKPAMDVSDHLLKAGRQDVLGPDRMSEIRSLRARLEKEMQMMARVQEKGLELEKAEQSGKPAE